MGINLFPVLGHPNRLYHNGDPCRTKGIGRPLLITLGPNRGHGPLDDQNVPDHVAEIDQIERDRIGCTPRLTRGQKPTISAKSHGGIHCDRGTLGQKDHFQVLVQKRGAQDDLKFAILKNVNEIEIMSLYPSDTPTLIN